VIEALIQGYCLVQGVQEAPGPGADPEIGFSGGHLQCPFLGTKGTEPRRLWRRGGGEWEGVSPPQAARGSGERRKPQAGSGTEPRQK